VSKKRMVNIELYQDSRLQEAIGNTGLHLYLISWMLAEDSGCLEYYPPDFKLQCGALKASVTDIENTFNTLCQHGKVIPYEVNGKQYLWLKNFHKHQILRNPPPPSLPLPPWLNCSIQETGNRKRASYSVDESKLPEGAVFATRDKQVSLKGKEGNRKEDEEKGDKKTRYLDDVYLTDQQYEQLNAKWGDVAPEMIEFLNNYKMRTGKKYKSDYHALVGWVADSMKERGIMPKDPTNGGAAKKVERCKHEGCNKPVHAEGECYDCMVKSARPMPKELEKVFEKAFAGKEM